MKKQNNDIGITKIYLVTNCHSNPNWVYIGKTKNSRESNHKNKFGDKIEYTYIDEVNSLDKKDWEPLETYWIEQFRQWGFEIMNIRKKGGSGPEYHSKEAKLKIGEKLRGVSRSYLSFNKKRGEKISNKLKGRVMSLESSIKKSNKLTGKPKHTPLSKQKISNSKKSHPCYKNEDRNRKISNKLKGSTHTKNKINPIAQFDMDMNYIKTYPNQTSVCTSINISSGYLSYCIKHNKVINKKWIFKKI